MENESKILSDAIHEQYGAALEMIEQVIKSCPDKLWNDNNNPPSFWYIVYHVLWFTDWYLAASKEEREREPSKFGKESTMNLHDPHKNKLTPDQLLDYLTDIKAKAKKRFSKLTYEDLLVNSFFGWHGKSVLSSLLYNLRHIMIHVGALNLRIRNYGEKLENWIGYKKL